MSQSSNGDAVLAKMDEQRDELLKFRNLQETKLNSILEKLNNLEESQKETAEDVTALKSSYSLLDQQLQEMNTEVTLKASREELTSINKKMEDLENRSKRNNVVLWGLKEGAEATNNSLELFLKEEFFEKHMQLQDIEVMRAHRTTVSQRSTSAATSSARPIHVYLLS